MAKLSFNQVKRNAVKNLENEGIVPYDEQTPEQREQFIGRVSALCWANVLVNIVKDNFVFIEGIVKIRSQNPFIYDKLKQVSKSIETAVPELNSINNGLMAILTKNEESKDQVEIMAAYAYLLQKEILSVPLEKFEIAINAVKSISSETFQAESTEDYENKMIAFGNHCMNMKGRKTATKNDLKKFLSNYGN